MKRWRKLLSNLITLFAGALIAALAYSLFLVPFNIAAGGVGGISIIINSFTGWPIGTLYLIMNIPLLVLGYFLLGGWSFLWRTVLAVVIFSLSIDIFSAGLPMWLDIYPLTDDVLINAIYGGILGGIGAGMLYRSGGTLGGTSILGRIVQRKTGAPLSQIYIYTDGIIIFTAGLVFGWELALYAALTLFLNGVASDYTQEGPSVVRTVTIITDHPDTVSKALAEGLGRGVSYWGITGAYTGRHHSMLMCTVYRSQVTEMRQIIADVDREAFVVIGTAHQALGSGFRPIT